MVKSHISYYILRFCCVFYSLQTVLRACVVVLSGIVVLVIPNFSTLMAFFGSSCCTLLGFVLPGIFHLRIFEG